MRTVTDCQQTAKGTREVYNVVLPWTYGETGGNGTDERKGILCIVIHWEEKQLYQTMHTDQNPSSFKVAHTNMHLAYILPNQSLDRTLSVPTSLPTTPRLS